MIGTIRLGNKRAGSKLKPVAGEIVIDGDRKSPVLGNLHILSDHRDPEERSLRISQHLVDVLKDRDVNGPIERELQRIAGLIADRNNVIIMCWCTPNPCHCDCYRDRIVGLTSAGAPGQLDLL